MFDDDEHVQDSECAGHLLQLHSVCKRYGQVDVINGVSLQISDGEFIVFVGAGSSWSLDPNPGVLSGNQWQRIAIGRAIVHTGRALARNALQSQLVPA
ncbi:MAG TPA: hypothetical protein VNR40_19255 [Steroidobacter sp.]|nr:hypothetical protein [Steroidobacter sp.]